jgi:predicted PurR-regulated permease PerM
MNKTWSVQTRYFMLGLIIVFVAIVAWYIRAIFPPLIIAGLIAYLLYPLVVFLQTRLRLRRKVAANIVYFVCLALMFAVPATLVPTLFNEATQVTADLNHMLNQVQDYLARPLVIAGISIHLEQLIPTLKASLTGLAAPLPQDAWRLIESTSRGALWLLIIVVGAYYFMTDWERLREWLIRLSPEAYQTDARRLYLEIKQVWMAYLRGQVTLMLIVGVVFSVLWSVIGLPGALILGILGGLLSLIPDVGPFVATALAVIIALLEGSNWIPWNHYWFAALVAGLYVVLINIKSIWLRPRILGRSVRMHEGLIFISIIAAVVFTGVLGALLVVPVLASAGVLLKYLRHRILGLPPFPAAEPVVSEDGPVPGPGNDAAPKPKKLRKKKG